MAKPGVKECELYAEMVRTQIANGAEAQIFLLLTSGPIDGDEEGVKHLLHGNDQPISPTTRELRKGDIVLGEFHTNYGGYMTATEFTVCLGKAPREYHKIHDVSVESLHAQIEHMRPGVTLRELWEAARAPVEKAGLEFLELGFHGHGMASPEFPVVVYKPGKGIMSGDHIGNMLLEEGMVFGNNIDVYDPRWKIDVGHMLGDCLVIEASGARRLVDVPEELVEVNA
jgi:Xaa-Pro aminopeptidase